MMMPKITGLILILFVICSLELPPAEGAKILSLFPVATKSHMKFFTPLLRELASRGHDITVVSIFNPYMNTTQLKVQDIPELLQFLIKESTEHVFEESSDSPLSKVFGMRAFFRECFKIAVNSPAIKELVKKGKQYDIVLVTGYANEFAVQIAPLLAEHVIVITPSPVMIMLTFPYTLYSSFIPERFFSFPPRMNFLERLQNVIGTFIARKTIELIQNDANSIVLEAFPNALTMAEAQNKISIILLNSDPILSLPQPTTPRMISIGGMHLSDAKPLSEEFQKVVEASGEDGFIVFTLGSTTPSEKMPQHIKEAFLSAFSRLKQKVIWRYEGEISNLPSNVYLSPWLPQKDLLGHPKCRAFITHGGMLGLQEAIYLGVPIIGIPLYGDQYGNLALMKSYGVGETLGEILKLTSESVYETVTKVLETESYATNMKQYSSIIRDEMTPAVERGVYWVEYVLRHNGALHLRSPGEDLGFIQYYLLDIIAFLLLAMAIGIGLIIFGVRMLLRFIRKFKQNERAEKKKKH